jgi:cytochrome b subunit of formate dehydrogenase
MDQKNNAKEVVEMEERNEASASIWVWVVIIAIAAALIAGVVIFLRP